MQETCKLPPTVGFAPVSRFARGLFGVVEEGEDVAVEFYNAWKDAVIAEVPKDCLLIFQVKDGWNPLCEYLGVESPSTPFPRMNDTSDVDEQHVKISVMLFGLSWPWLSRPFSIVSFKLNERNIM